MNFTPAGFKKKKVCKCLFFAIVVLNACILPEHKLTLGLTSSSPQRGMIYGSSRSAACSSCRQPRSKSGQALHYFRVSPICRGLNQRHMKAKYNFLPQEMSQQYQRSNRLRTLLAYINHAAPVLSVNIVSRNASLPTGNLRNLSGVNLEDRSVLPGWFLQQEFWVVGFPGG